MTRTVRVATLAVAGTLIPGLAAACPACLSSAYGDRTYNWAYVGLLLMPFLLAVAIGAILAWSAGYRLDLAWLRRALPARRPSPALRGFASPLAPSAPGAPAPPNQLKETT
jgi:hypothetical protein